MSITASFKDLFDVSISYAANTSKIWQHNLLMLYTCATFCNTYTLLHIKSSNKNVCCHSNRLWMDTIFMSLDTVLQSILISNMVTLVLW